MYYRRMWSTGINRNIVECKVFYPVAYLEIYFSINRNIVECKGTCLHAPTGDFRVLIETLWNVKLHHQSIALERFSVLIETLWNVKENNPDLSSGSLTVLIETLWNVKCADCISSLVQSAY